MKNGRIEEAKRRLPLPALMESLGLGDYVKKSGHCLFHTDKHPSFSVYEIDGRSFWKCHAGCGHGDEIAFLEKHLGVSKKDAIARFLEIAGVNRSRPTGGLNKHRANDAFDWHTSAQPLSEEQLEHLSKWRGYSPDFCRWLANADIIRWFEECFAFPIDDSNGNIVAAHYRIEDGSWRVFPIGVTMQPLIIGKLDSAATVHDYESQWDAFAVCDKLGLHEREDVAVLITRGAENGRLVKGRIPASAKVFAWKQNDELKNGKRAGDKWLDDVAAQAGGPVEVVTVPLEFKDVNEWTRSGATADDLEAALDRAKTVGATSQSLAELLDAISGFLRRFVVFSLPEQAQVIALWVAHTWALDAFDYSPYLHVSSPEKQCGKGRVLDCLKLLTPKPWRTVLPSEAVLFRKIDAEQPTLLLDELDGVFTGNGKDEKQEGLRVLLNAGFERKARVPRCVGQGTNQQVKDFAVFCAKALAGIGKMPDTVRDRSIPIRLVRRARDEKVERFRERQANQDAAPIHAALETWAKKSGLTEHLRRARPKLPDALSDRQQDICEPLLAIADLAGAESSVAARQALLRVYETAEDQDDSLGVKLLADIHRIFDSGNVDRMSTQELLEGLVALEGDAPWAGWWEKDVNDGKTRGPASKLAKLLKPYGIRSVTIRLDDGTTPKGYHLADFVDAWKRYCPPTTL